MPRTRRGRRCRSLKLASEPSWVANSESISTVPGRAELVRRAALLTTEP